MPYSAYVRDETPPFSMGAALPVGGFAMKRKNRFKSILVSLLVTAALAVPAVVLALTPSGVDAYLLFRMDGGNGSGLYTMGDGSVQARIAVSICGGQRRNGASFVLDYNPDYFTPSDAANAPLDDPSGGSGQVQETDEFFTYNPDLYGGKNPFAKKIGANINISLLGKSYSQLYLGESQIIMNLWLDQASEMDLSDPDDMVEEVEGYSDDPDETRSVFTGEEEIVLGILTFRVNPDRLSEIARYFHNFKGGVLVEDPEIDANYVGENVPTKTFLVKVPREDYGESVMDANSDPWSIGYYRGEEGGMYNAFYKQGTLDGGQGTVFYKNDVDNNTVVSVRPARDEVTVNSYQAFTNGDVGDIALTLGQHSPMATVTYIDGREENVVIPWGDDHPLAGAYTVKNADGSDIAAYHPTQGDYIITQRIQDPHAPGGYIPLPVAVRLHVTPIKLVDVQVEDQTRTYWLDEVLGQIEDPADLALPDQARLVTDIVPGGVSMVMDIPGWAPAKGTWPRLTEGNTNQNTLMNSLKEDSFVGDEYAAAAEPKWPSIDDTAAITNKEFGHFLGNYDGKWVGKYTFRMSEGYGTAEAPKPAAKAGFTKAEIQGVYPWLTVERDSYTVPTVLRRIVTKENYTPAASYEAAYVSTVDEEVLGQIEPTLTLNVKRRDETAMAESSIFRVWLPDGRELGTGLTTAVWPEDAANVDNWFPQHDPAEGETWLSYQNGYYKPQKREIGGVTSFNLVTNPGNPEDDTWNAERETLRRYINLGGWFYVTVTEDPTSRAWSDPIPVYVPPRPNEYAEDKVYNFLGDNSDLFVWTGGLTHYVSLPNGTYYDVDDAGRPLYQVGNSRVTAADLPVDQKDSYGRPNGNATRATASYSYATTYDGVTGAQPGALNVFRVDDVRQPSGAAPARGAIWTPVTSTVDSKTVYTYGANPFFDEALYDGYGTVKQHREADNTVSDPETATIRRGNDRAVPGSRKITLTSVEPTGITRVDQDDLTSNVTQVTYNTKEEGYTARQSYTLTITNHGTEPVYGLAIDALTDGYEKEPAGGHFVMDKAPADYLAPGTSTTFILTYVYDLEANFPADAPYHDILYITSSDHPTGGTGADADYLLKFDAEVLISSQPTHNVDVVVLPEDLKMGSAHLIIGQLGGSGPVNYTPTAQSYASGAEVYVVVEPEDEYSFIDPTLRDPPAAVDALGHPIEVTKVNVPEGQSPVYRFLMPDYDTTVTIRFYEDTYSKLRLSNLIDFSGDKQEDLKQAADEAVAAEDTYTVWRKSFTDEERTAAAAWANDKGGKSDFYLMTAGRPVPAEEGGNTFVSSENQYLVVIPFDAAYSQVEATLRALVTHNDYKGVGENKDITPTVTMHWYGKDVRDKWTIDNDGNTVIYSAASGDTAGPTKHTSVVFDSPDPGTSNYVRITVEAADQAHTQRIYYLEIHRRPENPIATLHYGNSPYGMIMNASNFRSTTAEATNRLQNAAKNAFKAGYTFQGLAQDYLPAVLQGDDPVAKVSGVTFWREAWVNNTQVYEPESNTGYLLHTETSTDPETGATTSTHTYEPDPAVYDESTNLDLNDYAYFATLGETMMEPGLVEALDSSGRPVELTKIMVSAEVTLLDTTKVSQVERFSGAQTAILDLGVANAKKTPLAADATTAEGYNWPASSKVESKTETVDGEEQTVETTVYTPVHNIRPGQYVLTYTYPDFDGGSLSVTRPFVILSETGDVNVDGSLNSTRFPETTDEDAKKRTDEYVLENRVADPLGYEAGKWEEVDGVWTETVYPRANIFKYRVCDVNNDRNVNNIDGNEINRLAGNEGADPLTFYDPVRYGHPMHPVTP